MCKSFAPRSRQITTPASHHSIFFTGRILFPMPSQQCQSTYTSVYIHMYLKLTGAENDTLPLSPSQFYMHTLKKAQKNRGTFPSELFFFEAYVCCVSPCPQQKCQLSQEVAFFHAHEMPIFNSLRPDSMAPSHIW